MAQSPLVISIDARRSYIALSSIYHSFSKSTSRKSSSRFRRSDFTGQPFTGSYEPEQKPSGPLGDASVWGVPTRTPREMKYQLDQSVVDQERAKKVLSVIVYNHYQRIQELQRREEEDEERSQQRLRRRRTNGHSLDASEEHSHHEHAVPIHPPSPALDNTPIIERSSVVLEKSNILLLGPSGVGKTLMAKTLARVLDVPFSISDCTRFTQAGYIGEDCEACVQRLLVAANHDVARAERGIICLDEIDKIKSAKVSHGKDVGGEGVQQALLKIIEGTTLQIQGKQEKSSTSKSPGSSSGSYSTNGPLSGGVMSPSDPGNTTTGPSKPETYSVRTDNILFICTGAFVGLEKLVLNRIAKGSMGFNSIIRSPPTSNNVNTSISIKQGSDEGKLFEKHLPFFMLDTSSPVKASTTQLNLLDLVEPTDLQSYGLIPELIGRIPVYAALSSLDEDALVRVLTEPRNSLVKQYEHSFHLMGAELRFTRGALREMAKSSLDMGTGARGLRTCCERLLTDAMYEAPGSSIKYVLITESVAKRKVAPIYFARGQQHQFQSLIAAEEEEWDAKLKSVNDSEHPMEKSIGSFEEYREKSRAVGMV